MNILFVTVFVLCTVLICVTDPSAFLPALLAGGQRAVTLCITLAAVYAVWLGILRVAEDAGVLRGMARGFKPLTRRLFRTDNDRALEMIAVNLSANLLGMGGAATPAGISAMRLLQKERGEFPRAMLFVVNCAGLQIFPTTVVSLRAAAGAASAYDVVLPILLSSVSALVFGAALVFLIYGSARRSVKMKKNTEKLQNSTTERRHSGGKGFGCNRGGEKRRRAKGKQHSGGKGFGCNRGGEKRRRTTEMRHSGGKGSMFSKEKFGKKRRADRREK